ncbi:MAG: flagellar basal body rod protein FlgB [Lachnospiraceae bacterium]|nr:flagellar basal body rod protein FlgB [Lachnospiraceae bacterium]
MIGSNAYNYINVLDKAADASWKRNELIAENIANVDTPNYKRKDVQFEAYLRTAVSGGKSLDDDINNIDLNTINSTTYTEAYQYSFRMDNNNVDISTENAELAKNQLRYYTLLDSMTQEFSRIKSVLSQAK